MYLIAIYSRWVVEVLTHHVSIIVYVVHRLLQIRFSLESFHNAPIKILSKATRVFQLSKLKYAN